MRNVKIFCLANIPVITIHHCPVSLQTALWRCHHYECKTILYFLIGEHLCIISHNKSIFLTKKICLCVEQTSHQHTHKHFPHNKKKDNQRHTIKLVFYLQPPHSLCAHKQKGNSLWWAVIVTALKGFPRKEEQYQRGKKKCDDAERANLCGTLQKWHEVSGCVPFH